MTLPPLCDLGAFLVLSHFSLLINPSPSRCGFDAADAGAVLILSPKTLQRWATVIVMGTTRALENPSGEMRECETVHASEGIPTTEARYIN